MTIDPVRTIGSGRLQVVRLGDICMPSRQLFTLRTMLKSSLSSVSHSHTRSQPATDLLLRHSVSRKESPLLPRATHHPDVTDPSHQTVPAHQTPHRFTAPSSDPSSPSSCTTTLMLSHRYDPRTTLLGRHTRMALNTRYSTSLQPM